MIFTAILIHFAGYAIIDGFMPHNATVVDADLLAVWYGSFALVDLIAWFTIKPSKGFAYQVAFFAIATSGMWSASVMFDMLMMTDTLQSADPDIQRYIDFALGGALVWNSLREAYVSRHARA